MAVGRDGQFLYVDPAHDTVVVRLGKRLGPLSQAQWAAVFAALSAHAW
jgi:CubicO group peptidase (beta-lactamase class C family)